MNLIDHIILVHPDDADAARQEVLRLAKERDVRMWAIGWIDERSWRCGPFLFKVTDTVKPGELFILDMERAREQCTPTPLSSYWCMPSTTNSVNG